MPPVVFRFVKMHTVTFGKKLRSRGLFFSFFLISAINPQLSTAQTTSIAFWNVENLYDTVPSPFYDDSDYTPDGLRRWGAERYGRKIANLARVIDEMSADIVGLAEVESEAAVRDLVAALETDYNYIHRTSGDSRGMDVVLLYKGDRFFPESVRLAESGGRREFLHVTGELSGETIEIVVCHMASNLNDYGSRLSGMRRFRGLLERLLEDDPAARIVVMGDMNAAPGEKVVRQTLGRMQSPYDFMYCPHWERYMAGQGTYSYRGHWYMYDWMLVSPSLARGSGMRAAEAGIFVREYMTEPSNTNPSPPRKPLRTFYGGEYPGGYSDHLPVWLFIVK